LTALDCQRWGVLPRAGGLRAQDARQLSEMAAALNAYTIVLSYDAARDKIDWRNERPESSEWLDWLMNYIADEIT
jgi:hypothetical protein